MNIAGRFRIAPGYYFRLTWPKCAIGPEAQSRPVTSVIDKWAAVIDLTCVVVDDDDDDASVGGFVHNKRLRVSRRELNL